MELELGLCPEKRNFECSISRCHTYGERPENCTSDYIDSLNEEVEYVVQEEGEGEGEGERKYGKTRVEKRREKEILAEDLKEANYRIRGVEDHINALNAEDAFVFNAEDESTSFRLYLDGRKVEPLPFKGEERKWYVRSSELLNRCIISRIIANVDDEDLNDYFRERGLPIRTNDWYSSVGGVLHKVCLTQPEGVFAHNHSLKTPIERNEYCEKSLCYELGTEGILVGGHPDIIARAEDELVILDLKRSKNLRRNYKLQLLSYAKGVSEEIEKETGEKFEKCIVVNVLHEGFGDITARPRYKILVPEGVFTPGGRDYERLREEVEKSHRLKQRLIKSRKAFEEYKRSECGGCYWTTKLVCDEMGYDIVGFLGNG